MNKMSSWASCNRCESSFSLGWMPAPQLFRRREESETWDGKEDGVPFHGCPVCSPELFLKWVEESKTLLPCIIYITDEEEEN
jgi:hypothetical protein